MLARVFSGSGRFLALLACWPAAQSAKPAGFLSSDTRRPRSGLLRAAEMYGSPTRPVPKTSLRKMNHVVIGYNAVTAPVGVELERGGDG